jgi:hypothetical protein
MEQTFEIIAKTFMGLEPVLAKELTRLGANNVQIGRRMVSFTGDKELLYRANFQLHTAIKILKPIRHFKAKSADDVYEQIRKIDWTEYLGNDKTFAVIRSKGDQALFRLSTATLKRKMNVPANRPLADFLPTISIKAKDFAAELTSVNVQTKDLQNQSSITQEHIENNAAVRRILLERGVVPEDLPAEEDVKKVERRLASEKKKAIENKRK